MRSVQDATNALTGFGPASSWERRSRSISRSIDATVARSRERAESGTWNVLMEDPFGDGAATDGARRESTQARDALEIRSRSELAGGCGRRRFVAGRVRQRARGVPARQHHASRCRLGWEWTGEADELGRNLGWESDRLVKAARFDFDFPQDQVLLYELALDIQRRVPAELEREKQERAAERARIEAEAEARFAAHEQPR